MSMTKNRTPSPSHHNVVDHDAPNVTDDHVGGSSTVTKQPGKSHMIQVHPLKRSEMQPSYAQDLGTGECRRFHRDDSLLPMPQPIPQRQPRQVSQNYVAFCVTHTTTLQLSHRLFLEYSFPSHAVVTLVLGSVGLVSRFGQFYKAVDPGLVQVNVCTESLRIVDVKIQISPIGRQTVITRDNVNVEIDSVIYFQICSPYRAAFGITDLRQALIERAQTTLRHVVGARAVQSVVTEREAIAFEIAEIVGDVADKWGVAIEGILIKDIIFSPEISASLSSAAQQKRIGESKVIAARAEVDAARLMRQAADILASPAAMQIRQLEALQQMAKSGNSKVIFVPMQLQSDVASKLSNNTAGPSGSNVGAMIANEAGDAETGLGGAGQVGVLNSIASM
ncbi:hypothetical protein D9758_004217 [Tetrapyrgos nigripes]|uniref:Band 7 domain-containing protein n=1 Tax=Tetrapyrgos nigripes TaxID=182062 RepID=A0A8H5GUA0_9AGAR|nr:hypothetical protein D9758_004217 [Tetrapyrgos nigripes]